MRGVVGFAIFLTLVPALLFIAAGTMAWIAAWVYAALLVVSSVGSRLVVWKRNPDLLRERAQFTNAPGTKSWDRGFVAIAGLLGPAVMSILAGLDHRFGWGPRAPLSLQIIAAILIGLGYGIGVWAMVANRFFSAVARVQEDRGHTVVTSGPYQLLRHPAYAGALVAYLALPVMLDALWVFIPAMASIIVLFRRTTLEDQMLLRELGGYTEYAQTTRFRLIPGLW